MKQYLALIGAYFSAQIIQMVRVALGRVTLPLPFHPLYPSSSPTCWNRCPSQYLSGNNSALRKSSEQGSFSGTHLTLTTDVECKPMLQNAKPLREIPSFITASLKPFPSYLHVSEPLTNDHFQTRKRFRRTLFIRTRQNQQTFGVTPFVKLQNDT